MGLDVYVGSLTRYYTGQWETVVQQYGREQGLKVEVLRVNEPEDVVTDVDQVSAAVHAWMGALGRSLAPHLDDGAEFAWEDTIEQPYFTDKPAWDCYGSLMLWAAYAEQPELRCPLEHVEGWPNDPAVLASQAKESGTHFPHLLCDIELWLPVDFPFTFQGPDVAGNTVGIGSCQELHRELALLNEMTWNADDELRARWRREGAKHQSPVETGARFVFSIFRELSERAVEHRLPMKLDY